MTNVSASRDGTRHCDHENFVHSDFECWIHKSAPMSNGFWTSPGLCLKGGEKKVQRAFYQPVIFPSRLPNNKMWALQRSATSTHA
jgi:hypothetical protein